MLRTRMRMMRKMREMRNKKRHKTKMQKRNKNRNKTTMLMRNKKRDKKRNNTRSLVEEQQKTAGLQSLEQELARMTNRTQRLLRLLATELRSSKRCFAKNTAKQLETCKQCGGSSVRSGENSSFRPCSEA